MSRFKQGEEKINMEVKNRLLLLEQTYQMHENVRREFVSDGIIYKSERGCIFGLTVGVLYWLDEYEKLLVEMIEKKYNVKVYYVIHSLTSIGEMYSFLYVSCFEDEWEYDRDGLKNGYPLAIVYNKDFGESEIGSIGIEGAFGGLIRTA